MHLLNWRRPFELYYVLWLVRNMNYHFDGQVVLILMTYLFGFWTERASFITRPMCADHCSKKSWNSGVSIPTKWSLAAGWPTRRYVSFSFIFLLLALHLLSCVFPEMMAWNLLGFFTTIHATIENLDGHETKNKKKREENLDNFSIATNQLLSRYLLERIEPTK